IITFLVFLTGKNNCEKLGDGDYLVKHTLNGAPDYRLTIKGEKYSIQTDDSKIIKGEVNWIDDCSFKLEPKNPAKQDTFVLAKKIYQSFGEPFIQIKNKKFDTTFFRTTWTANLHITINEGYFLSVK